MVEILKHRIMKNIKKIILSIAVVLTIVVASGFTNGTSSWREVGENPVVKTKQNQTVNLFVSHGHCSLPFGGIVDDLKIVTSQRDDQGNPLEGMKISFAIDPSSFNSCVGEEYTAQVKTPGLFFSNQNQKITFQSTHVYTKGVDWYQINGIMSIKGVEREVTFFATGIRNPKDAMPSSLVLEGQMNLFDFGIDYEKIINRDSEGITTKWMHINMKVDLC